ncbi:MAG: hypothetical protein ACYYK0_00920 [Candidatus Eutrophobiaceae bacterium]
MWPSEPSFWNERKALSWLMRGLSDSLLNSAAASRLHTQTLLALYGVLLSQNLWAATVVAPADSAFEMMVGGADTEEYSLGRNVNGRLPICGRQGVWTHA